MKITVYERDDGTCPFSEWFDDLKATEAAKVTTAIARLEEETMALTRDFNQAVVTRTQRDSEYAIELLKEAISALLNDEPDIARLLLRDLINGTIGFEPLSTQVGIPSKSLHRMLSARGNPSMNNLSAIIGVLRRTLCADVTVATSSVRSANGVPADSAAETDDLHFV